MKWNALRMMTGLIVLFAVWNGPVLAQGKAPAGEILWFMSSPSLAVADRI